MSAPSRGTPPDAWDQAALRAPHAQRDKAARVAAMFDAIAGTYERVNSIASLGSDAAWRRRAVAAAGVRAGDVVLDICCGTGDMVRAFAAAEPAPRVVIGVDFAAGMLAQARREDGPTPQHFVRGDALRLPLADESVDVLSCVFGVRNFQDLQTGLCEMGRVARRGARLVILEFTTPDNPVIRWGHRFYTEVLLPRMATLVSGDRTGAYRYLPRSIQTFETRQTLARRIEDAGFAPPTQQLMNLGGVVLYRAEKAEGVMSDEW